MQRFAESIDIDADTARVWRALTIPAEVIRWDTAVVEALDAPPDYPRVGQHVRWRYPLVGLALILHDRPTRVESRAILSSYIRLGPFDFAETYTLCARGSSTQLSEELLVSSFVPMIGRLLLWFAGRSLARSIVQGSLRAIKQHCEQAD